MQERFFNTAGPIKKNLHYYLDPLSRWNLNEIMQLIASEKYFVLHAPRQVGKTTSLLSLMEYLNKEGQYTALYANIETAQMARNDISEGMKSILSEIAGRAAWHIKDRFLEENQQGIYDSSSDNEIVKKALSLWCEQNTKPVVLLLDEVDALVGDTLISLLRQLRSGYDRRPGQFPQSIVLCGVRDVRDYRIHSGSTNEIITGGSAFNIKAESLTMGNFSLIEIESLLKEHTKATGQIFAEGVLDYFWEYTEGQPYLVNALAYEACFKNKANRDRSRLIKVEHIEQAKENLIWERVTHLDQLVDKLKEQRVHRVIEPLLSGKDTNTAQITGDIQYVADLGLIKIERQGDYRIANGIYREVIPRELVWPLQSGINHEEVWYIDQDDKSLLVTKLIAAFQQFFRENAEHWLDVYNYKEAGPQLILQAFLHRIINGGGLIEREYGLGRTRTDIFIRWFYGEERYPGREQRAVIECKILHKGLEYTIEQGLKQIAAYMDKCGTDEGHLIIFDRTEGKSWDEKVWQREEEYENKQIVIWGM